VIVKNSAQRAVDAVNDMVMDPELDYDTTRTLLLAMQMHVAHLLTHFPERLDEAAIGSSTPQTKPRC